MISGGILLKTLGCSQLLTFYDFTYVVLTGSAGYSYAKNGDVDITGEREVQVVMGLAKKI